MMKDLDLVSLERERLARLNSAAKAERLNAQDLALRFEPGSFGCHEALHAAAMLGNLADETLAGHPAVLAKSEWFVLAAQAVAALGALYQAIGAEHLEGGQASPASKVVPR